MSDMIRLEDIGVFISGGTPSRKHPEYFEGTIPWVSTPALSGGLLDSDDAVQFITDDAIANSATKLLPPRSLLIGIRVGVGKTAVNVVPMCTNQDIVAITGVDEDHWNIQYLSYAVQAKSAYLVSQKQGATITGITSKLLKSLEVKRVDIKEQDRCVSNLDCIRLRIGDYERQLNKLDELVKSRFVEMFGDPEINDIGFESATGKELFKIGNGKTRPNDKRFEEGIPAYGGNGVSWYTDEALVDFDTIIIGRVGRHCGNTRLVKAPAWVTDNAMFIKDFKRDCFELVFLSYLMGVIDFNRFADQGDLWKISQKPFMEYRFYIPPRELQQEFASFVQQVDKLEFETQQAIDKLQMLYDSLAQEYFGDWGEHGEE